MTLFDAAPAPLVPVMAYQGGKARLAGQLVDHWWADGLHAFYDVCSGSGAVTIEMINRGMDPLDITMVEAGPWGDVYAQIGTGAFDVDLFRRYVAEIPDDPAKVQEHISWLSTQDATVDTAQVFLLLQAASFGGKAIWRAGAQWRNTSFRNYWLPTATSNRRSPVNPMMPMPKTLLVRVEALLDRLAGVSVASSVADVDFIPGALVYIDPPYAATTAYGHALDEGVDTLAIRLARDGLSVWVSEGRALDTATSSILVHRGRAKGGISHDRHRRAKPNEEWLSWFSPSLGEAAR